MYIHAGKERSEFKGQNGGTLSIKCEKARCRERNIKLNRETGLLGY